MATKMGQMTRQSCHWIPGYQRPSPDQTSWSLLFEHLEDWTVNQISILHQHWLPDSSGDKEENQGSCPSPSYRINHEGLSLNLLVWFPQELIKVTRTGLVGQTEIAHENHCQEALCYSHYTHMHYCIQKKSWNAIHRPFCSVGAER